MKLIQVKLSGFKSFGISTTIDIKGDLIGVVGPNGCGKSNIIDAVRWVLGESSAKEMRGSAMQDVIFNGSENKAKVSRAAVELIFDNSKHLGQGLWAQYSELSLKRVLTRDGDSNYYINNQVVRRKDITELFLGTGAGARGYAIIEQGMINKIIDASKEELKAYLEEAAGVSKYREKRKETLSKLENTSANLTRLCDIEDKLNQQEVELQDQAQITQKYNEWSHSLSLIKTAIVKNKITKANTNLTKLNNEYGQNEAALQNVLKELSELNLDHYHQEVSRLDQDKEHLQKQIGDINTLLAVSHERQSNNLELQKRLSHDREVINGEINQLQDSLTSKNQQIIAMEAQYKDLNQQFQELNHQKGEKIKVVELAKNQYVSQLDAKNTVKSKLDQLNSELKINQNSSQYKLEQQERLNVRLDTIKQETVDSSFDFTQKYNEIKAKIANLDQTITSSRTQIDDLKLTNEGHHETRNQLQQNINKLKQENSALNSKIGMLNSLIQNHGENNKNNVQAYQKIWQKLEVTPGYELALELALGDFFSAYFVDDLNSIDPNQFVNKIGFYYANASESSAKVGTLSQYVKFNDQRLTSLYQFLNNYVVAKDLSEARTIIDHEKDPALVVITEDHHLLSSNYLTLHAKKIDSSNQLIYKRELKDNQAKQQDITAQINNDEASLLKLNEQIQAIDNQLKTNYEELRQYEANRQNLQIELAKEEQIYLQAKSYQEKLTQEINTINGELASLNDALKQLSAQSSSLDQEIEAVNTQYNNLDVESSNAKYQQCEAEYQKFLESFNYHQQNCSEILQRLHLEQEMYQNQTNSLVNLEAKVAKLTTEYEEAIAISYNIEIQESQVKLENLNQELAKVMASLVDLNQTITQLQNQYESLTNHKERLNNKQNEINLSVKELTVLLQTYSEDEADLDSQNIDLTNLEQFINLSHKVLEQMQQEHVSKIQALGLVNQKAIEDLDEVKNKKQELSYQLNDVNQAIEVLKDAISQIDQESKKMLISTYEQVDKSFAEYFILLFGGGSAKLVMLEDDILVSGLQIVASPLGKRNSSLSQLSGGEKALTAMSLIFAFFSLNPAPFCLLDEVDAPLDDANTMRFCDLLKNLSDKTQFLFISHNRITMEIADQLIGITMQEKGISSVISVDLVEASKYAS